ncbi:hypothetical protein KC685_02855 [Candidatus Dojkabacteria bacterium]|uniref:Uncharacterized protein n=1 Tax=Candidatus Dojkabacteria bacterium TaxID=2099670 RepID=A0A955KX65_9BACT|nr:hypothetical protein [Candidatus Dojkabacteria bacterium]
MIDQPPNTTIELTSPMIQLPYTYINKLGSGSREVVCRYNPKRSDLSEKGSVRPICDILDGVGEDLGLDPFTVIYRAPYGNLESLRATLGLSSRYLELAHPGPESGLEIQLPPKKVQIGDNTLNVTVLGNKEGMNPTLVYYNSDGEFVTSRTTPLSSIAVLSSMIEHLYSGEQDPLDKYLNEVVLPRSDRSLTPEEFVLFELHKIFLSDNNQNPTQLDFLDSMVSLASDPNGFSKLIMLLTGRDSVLDADDQSMLLEGTEEQVKEILDILITYDQFTAYSTFKESQQASVPERVLRHVQDIRRIWGSGGVNASHLAIKLNQVLAREFGFSVSENNGLRVTDRELLAGFVYRYQDEAKEIVKMLSEADQVEVALELIENGLNMLDAYQLAGLIDDNAPLYVVS